MPGALLGGLLIGLTEAMAGIFFTPSAKRMFSFALLVLVLLCIAGPWLSPYSYDEQDLAITFAPPSGSHWLGTDQLGRDLLVRILYGGRISFGVALSATFVALTIGVIYGAVAGYVGGVADSVMMRIVDIIDTLPFTIFVILLMVTFGSNFILIFVAIGAVEWLTMSRIVRGQTLTLKQKEFVEAARAAGMDVLGYAGGVTPAEVLAGPRTTVFDDMRSLPELVS